VLLSSIVREFLFTQGHNPACGWQGRKELIFNDLYIQELFLQYPEYQLFRNY